MSTYAIGDVQGCSEQLQRLVDRIRFNPRHDRLWFVGDLVNRGPDSAGVLRFVKSLGPSATAVLGNHDLFLLAVAEDIVKVRPKDTIGDVLQSEDRNELIDWLRHKPLHHREDAFLMVHAGLLPQWSTDDAVQLASEVGRTLSGTEYRSFLDELYNGSLPQWSSSLKGMQRKASIARVFTKLRVCTPGGELSSYSGPLEDVPAGYLPWFRIPGRRNKDATIITGHWAALGLHFESNLLAIDSGCVWGRKLSAVRLEDRAVFQVEGLHR